MLHILWCAAVLNSLSPIKNWRQLNSNNFTFFVSFFCRITLLLFFISEKFFVCFKKHIKKSVCYFFKNLITKPVKMCRVIFHF